MKSLDPFEPSSESPCNVWVDADACPKQIKEILFRAAERVRVQTVLVQAFANELDKFLTHRRG